MHRPIFHGGYNHRPDVIIIQNNYSCGGGFGGGGLGNIFSNLGAMFGGICAGLSFASLFAGGGAGYSGGYPMGGNMGYSGGAMRQPIFNQMQMAMPTQAPTEMPAAPATPGAYDYQSQQVAELTNNFMKTMPSTSATPSEPVKPVDPNNEGAKFDAWTQNNVSKFANGEAVEDFAFVGDDYAKALQSGDEKGAAEIYKKGIMKLSQDTLKLQDTNGDGKVSYEEFKAKELADYNKTFPGAQAVPATLEETTIKAFNNMNLDGSKDGLDVNEIASTYALYDNNIDLQPGESNGKISMKDFSYYSRNLSKEAIKDELQKRHTFLFGANG